MTLIEIATIGTLVISLLVLVRSIWDKRFDKIDHRFDKIDEQFKRVDEQFRRVDDQFRRVDDQFKELRDDMSDLRERVAGIEMSTIFLQVNPNPPSRSEIAKKMWEKRRVNQIEPKQVGNK